MQHLRHKGERRFLFVVNWRFPPTQLVCVFAPQDGAWPLSGSDPASCLARRFFSDEMDDSERKARFKIVPCVREGPWLVRTAVGSTPSIIGKALAVDIFNVPGDHCEVSIDVYSSSTAKQILSLVMGAAKKVAVEVGFVIESQTHEELPERVMSVFRVNRPDVSRVAPPI